LYHLENHHYNHHNHPYHHDHHHNHQNNHHHHHHHHPSYVTHYLYDEIKEGKNEDFFKLQKAKTNNNINKKNKVTPSF
jgi:hypothetical protein